MQSIMLELAEFCGFNFTATTFPELFLFFVLAVCGTAIIASIIKVMLWITFNMRKLSR